jgi:hypothetical protein
VPIPNEKIIQYEEPQEFREWVSFLENTFADLQLQCSQEELKLLNKWEISAK